MIEVLWRKRHRRYIGPHNDSEWVGVMAGRNFTARVVEPSGVAVRIEFHESIPHLTAGAVTVYLSDKATIEDAENLSRTLNRLGETFQVNR